MTHSIESPSKHFLVKSKFRPFRKGFSLCRSCTLAGLPVSVYPSSFRQGWADNSSVPVIVHRKRTSPQSLIADKNHLLSISVSWGSHHHIMSGFRLIRARRRCDATLPYLQRSYNTYSNEFRDVFYQIGVQMLMISIFNIGTSVWSCLKRQTTSVPVLQRTRNCWASCFYGWMVRNGCRSSNHNIFRSCILLFFYCVVVVMFFKSPNKTVTIKEEINRSFSAFSSFSTVTAVMEKWRLNKTGMRCAPMAESDALVSQTSRIQFVPPSQQYDMKKLNDLRQKIVSFFQ